MEDAGGFAVCVPIYHDGGTLCSRWRLACFLFLSEIGSKSLKANGLSGFCRFGTGPVKVFAGFGLF